MNILYVYAHPNPDSFNGLIKITAENLLKDEGHQIVFSDLYAEQFSASASWNDFNFD